MEPRHVELKPSSSQPLQFHFTELREFVEYTFWVSAFNANGEGAFSEEVTARTHSDLPSDPPQNVTLEPDSSTSVIARWEPPSKESRNGIITGYKIRWRPANSKRSVKGEVVTTDGSRRLFAITGLENGHSYEVKMAALTVNGSGPGTPWMQVTTFTSDLDEAVVPEPPSSLRARARSTSITITWRPPTDKRILVRGYTIGWGKGIPDVMTKVVDAKEREFLITGLKPMAEYVISLRAYNNIGDGRPVYETIRTISKAEDMEEVESMTPLTPPIKLHARIMSAKAALLTWMDSTLPRNQLIPDRDRRYYIVRYASTKAKSGYQYKNCSDLNVMIDDLRPNTNYEFVVKVVRGRRQSAWSMVTYNSTRDAAPGSPPRDLIVRTPIGAKPGVVKLSWRPPKFPNGAINGYIIHYSTDRRAQDRDWFVEAIMGSDTEATIRGLAPNTRYFFKMSARNGVGYGPVGSLTAFVTPKVGGNARQRASSGRGGNDDNEVSPVILYAVAGVGAGIIIVVIIGAAVLVHRCGKRSAQAEALDRLNKSYVNGNAGGGADGTLLKERLNPVGGPNGGPEGLKNPPPPDLWIGHDQLELKSMPEEGDETGETSIARSTPTVDYRSASSMDRSRNYIHPYSGK